MFSRWDNRKKTGVPATKHMRCEMLKYSIAIIVIGAWVVGIGCRDNEQSFYIDHVKSAPDAPECVTSEGDPFVTSGGIDLAVAQGYNATMLVTNALVSKENTANLQAETNGIFVDGSETYLESSDGAQIGGTEYFAQPVWLEPEGQGLADALMISSEQVVFLADSLGCLRGSSANYPYDTLGSTDANGQAVGRFFDPVYANVRFLGHTNGTLDVETPELKFLLRLCCGCSVDWSTCVDPCAAYCTAVEEAYCSPGILGDGYYPCSNIYLDGSATWECEDDTGATTTCGCETCS